MTLSFIVKDSWIYCYKNENYFCAKGMALFDNEKLLYAVFPASCNFLRLKPMDTC